MDLNVSPLPEEDVSVYSEIVDKGPADRKRRATDTEAMYQEGGGTHQRSKRKYLAEEPMQGFQTRNQGSYDRNSLPSGWLDCPAYGSEIGFIVPSKVPLGESFNDKITMGKRYSPQQAINEQRRLGRELGLVIDLTNTNRYYPERDWTKEGIRYVKIRCAGRDSVPDKESVDKFLHEVNQFGSQQSHRNKHVLVHCTHGHNRTGYMIVQFLIHTESVSVTEAIDRFARARPPGIYKQDYIDSLYSYYHERKPEFLVCPQTPEWKRSPDGEDDGAASLNDHVTRITEMTNDDILGDPVPPNQLEPMRQFVCQALKLRAGGKQYFPGSHPVSLSSKNLPLLSQRYYYATWKADGTRYMMLITWDGCYLIDRNFNFRRIQLRFPCRNVNEGAGNTHHYTLLDGEMIIDTDPSTQKQERRYLIYDMMAINQMSLVERPFSERWMLLENEVIKPRNCERDLLFKSRTPYYRYDLELFRVRRKDFFFLSTVTKLLKEFIPRLSHASDGLIFQGWDDPYVPRTHEGLLKWKFPEMNSVDFLFEVGANGRPLLFLHERGRKKLMEGERVVFKDESVDMLSLSGKILECSFDSEGKIWIFMRIRPDKSTPNEYNTYKKVMRSIYDNITEEVILEQMDQITGLPLYVDRIRNDGRAFQKNARRK